jgi:hypothetical protein
MCRVCGVCPETEAGGETDGDSESSGGDTEPSTDSSKDDAADGFADVPDSDGNEIADADGE